jgi:hypothetical protein
MEKDETWQVARVRGRGMYAGFCGLRWAGDGEMELQ